jgi:tRNA-modifying protein YgfZ
MADAKTFERIVRHAGLFDRSDRCLFAVSGPDRAKFLQNLLTNEVKRLPAGRGCEAFVTSLQGRTLAFVIALAADDSILVGTDPGGTVLLLPHFAKYGVFDDVAIEDRSASTFEYHVAGPAAEEIVRRCVSELPEGVDLAHVQSSLEGQPVRLVRESPAGMPGLTLIGDLDAAPAVKGRLLAAGGEPGVVESGSDVFEVLRIEGGTPVFGKDITDKNLPQEIGRDARAINFVKGCYLGQETVARLDALGHVNQVLKGLVFEPGSPCPEPGCPVEDEGKRAGVVTSSAFSPVRNAPIALAMIRTKPSAAGTKVQVALPTGSVVSAIVSDLPFRPHCP